MFEREIVLRFKKLDDELRVQVKDAIKIGYATYEKWEWIQTSKLYLALLLVFKKVLHAQNE